MSLLNGPDVAGILDALGRHGAAETLRWPEENDPHADCQAEIADLEDQLTEAIRERDGLEERVGQLKVEVEAMRSVVEAAEKLATNGSYSALLDLSDAIRKHTKDSAK